jgi:hypothetical protein
MGQASQATASLLGHASRAAQLMAGQLGELITAEPITAGPIAGAAN